MYTIEQKVIRKHLTQTWTKRVTRGGTKGSIFVHLNARRRAIYYVERQANVHFILQPSAVHNQFRLQGRYSILPRTPDEIEENWELMLVTVKVRPAHLMEPGKEWIKNGDPVTETFNTLEELEERLDVWLSTAITELNVTEPVARSTLRAAADNLVAQARS